MHRRAGTEHVLFKTDRLRFFVPQFFETCVGCWPATEPLRAASYHESFSPAGIWERWSAVRTTFLRLNVFVLVLVLVLCTAPAEAGHVAVDEAIFPQGWAPPSGWHVDWLVKRAVADGDLTGTGWPGRAVLLTNDVTVRLVVFMNNKSRLFKVYNVFEEPAAELMSRDGIKIIHSKKIEVEPVPSDCGTKWVRCDKGREFLAPPMPVLWLTMGDWGGSVFRWKNIRDGFDRFSVGD